MSIDLTTKIETRSGDLVLPTPIIGASGSFGHSNELFDVIDPNEVGAITIKSLAPFESPGNASPRVAAAQVGMMNSVGLPGPHIGEWVKESLPTLRKYKGRFIMALWGRTVDEYAQAAALLAPVAHDFVAIEVNLSCPNTEGNSLFAQSEESTRDAVAAVRKELGNDVIISAKLTSAVTRITDIVQGAIDGGTDMVTLFNTALGLVVDPYTRRPTLGKGGGGYSGAAVLPIAQRGVQEIHAAFPTTPIIGTGGVMSGADAAALMMCGASAVGVATATFADPRATIRITHELEDFCFETGVGNVQELVGAVQMPS